MSKYWLRLALLALGGCAFATGPRPLTSGEVRDYALEAKGDLLRAETLGAI